MEEQRVDLEPSDRLAAISLRDSGLSGRIIETAQLSLVRPAVRHNGSTVTYEDLLRLQEAIGAAVTDLCPAPGQLVGVFMERSVEMVASLVALHRIGNGFVPMDPSLPAGRLSSIVSDSLPSLILTQRSLVASVAEQATPFVCVEDIAGNAEKGARDSAAGEFRATGPTAYVMYTSGSTGEPKGVEIRHDGFVNQVLWRRKYFRIGPEDRVLQTFSLSFDPSIWEIFGTLEAGACIVINDDAFDASQVARCVYDERVTIMQTVPSMLRQLLDQQEFLTSSSLRHVICGGEVLEPDTVRRFYESTTTAQLHNLYGPTEATIDTTCWTCSPLDSGPRVPIGVPIANTEVLLLDPKGAQVPAGEPGEIHIAGPGVATGYYRKPKLTTARFINHAPDGGTGQGTYYRTGDRAVAREDGVLEFLGRLDRQVKIHGYRIEPGEVEAILAQCPLVDEAVVVAKDNPSGVKVLVAYVASDAADGPSACEQIRRHAAELLPFYMVPSVIVRLAALPRNVANKVDFGELPDPAWDGPQGQGAESLSSETARRAAGIWRETLGLESFHEDANFFELGGDSIALSECVAKLEESFGRRVEPGDFFAKSFRQIVGTLRDAS